MQSPAKPRSSPWSIKFNPSQYFQANVRQKSNTKVNSIKPSSKDQSLQTHSTEWSGPKAFSPSDTFSIYWLTASIITSLIVLWCFAAKIFNLVWLSSDILTVILFTWNGFNVTTATLALQQYCDERSTGIALLFHIHASEAQAGFGAISAHSQVWNQCWNCPLLA